VINPWLSDGRNTFRSIGEIVATTTSPEMSDREKALALYYREVAQRFHAHSADGETSDVVKVFNVYGYTTCGHDSMCMAALWRRAGLEVRPSRQAHASPSLPRRRLARAGRGPSSPAFRTSL
jgi:hypothetical protein